MSKSTAGFTKAAQAAKFVRNRDIQLKDSELRREAKISKESAEGICKRCREKAQWRFKYDKYKPLKNRGNCQNCKQKTIVKAYRTFCDPCAVKLKCCPGCTIPNAVSQALEAEIEKVQKKPEVEEDGEEADEMDEEDSDGGGEVKYTINTKKGPVTVFNKATAAATTTAPVDKEAEDEDEMVEEEDDEDEDDDVEYEDCDDDEEADEEDEEDAETEQPKKKKTAASTKPTKEISEYQQALNNAEADMDKEVKMMDMAWDEKKFTNMAASKYSKNRVVGAENDNIYYTQK